MYKVIVAGGREFTDFKRVHLELVKHFWAKNLNPSEVEIVSGGAQGADALGEKFAKGYKCSLKRFPADWKKHGRAAGPIRNKQMAEYADTLIAFDTGGRGTASMIKLAKENNLKVIVHQIKEANH